MLLLLFQVSEGGGVVDPPVVEEATRPPAGGGSRRPKDRYGRDVVVVREPEQETAPAALPAPPKPEPVVVRVKRPEIEKVTIEARSLQADLAALIEDDDEFVLLLAA